MSRPRGDRADGRPRRGRWTLLLVAVVAMHLWVTEAVTSRMGEAADDAAMPRRIAVAYVRTLEMTAPQPVAMPWTMPVPRRAAAVLPMARAASANQAAVDSADAVAAPTAAASSVDATSVADARPDARAAANHAEGSAPAASSVADVSADAAPAAAAASPTPASAVAFAWPASTRVTYDLTGNYRGAVSGHAQVEWIRLGPRYQVNIDFIVGPDFAPLISRRMTSEGALGSAGLEPLRYDESTKIVMRDPRHATVTFEADAVVIANGERRPHVAGMQDTASQFIQLTWLFTTEPDALQVGGRVEVPLALPRGTDRWIYDVLDEETLYTSFGPVPTVHLKPQRAARKPGDLSAEVWFAPQLRYMPVRIRIEQDAETFIDMVISRKPELAAG